MDAAESGEGLPAAKPRDLDCRAITCVKAVAGSLSIISGVIGALSLFGAWVFTYHGAKGGTEGWAAGLMLITGWGMIYVAVAVWLVPKPRWPIIRWAGAAFPAAPIAYSAWIAIVAPSPLFLFTLAYGAGAGSFLISPELKSSWRWMHGDRRS